MRQNDADACQTQRNHRINEDQLAEKPATEDTGNQQRNVCLAVCICGVDQITFACDVLFDTASFMTQDLLSLLLKSGLPNFLHPVLFIQS